MQRWLNCQAERSDCLDFLEQGFREHARNERVLLPGQSTIERMISQARTYAQEWIAKSITSDLSETDIQSIDDLRRSDEKTQQSVLQGIKAAIGCPSPNTLADILNRITLLKDMRLPQQAVESIHPDMRRRMTVTVQLYSVDNLYSDFNAETRRAYLACYLYERQKALVDFAIETFDSTAQGMYRRSECYARDDDVKRSAPAMNDKLRMFRTVARVMLDPDIPDVDVRNEFFDEVPREDLSKALTASDDLIRPEDFNCFDYLERRYTYLRTFFPRFLRVIELEGTPAAERILSAVRALKYWNAEAIRKVPASAPLDFVPAKWQPYVCPSDETVDRHYYELCVLNELHQALQSAEIWAVGGRRYGNIEDLLIPREKWEQVRDQCYQELELPKDPQVWLDDALGKLTAQIGKTTRNLSSNPQVFIEGDKVHLKSLDPIELPQRVTRLRQ